ncbi:MAG: helix-turn-helix domain-containing protein [Haloferacaceae archaeon]
MELTGRQREILATLVDGHRSREEPMTADEIAAELDRHPGTVHNHMQVLGTLGLVEGITGPRGGYEPTEAAAAALGERSDDDGDAVTVAHEYERVDLTVDEIRFLTVESPTTCRAVVRFRQTVTGIDVGDPVVVGPTPSGGLVLAGEVRLFDDAENELLLDLARAEAPVEE